MLTNLNDIRALLLLFFISTTTACMAQPPNLEELEGIYTYSFSNMLMDGTTYTSENKLTLLQTSPHALYFNTHLEWANGHSCDLSGIVERDLNSPKTLVYSKPSIMKKTCIFTIHVDKNKLFFSDKGGVCRLSACGARGMLEGVEFKYTTRKKISPANVKKTEDFKNATKEYFESGK